MARTAEIVGTIECEGDELPDGIYVNITIKTIDQDGDDNGLVSEWASLNTEFKKLQDKYKKTIDAYAEDDDEEDCDRPNNLLF